MPPQPALFSYGFRPFFLFGALFAGVSVPLWLLDYLGIMPLPAQFPARDWHIHEMLFGYVGAIIAGFLFTAVPNWTGRLPIAGMPLMGLSALWLAGRLALLAGGSLSWIAAMAIDCGFLAAIAATMAREIVAGRNWRNLKVLVPVLVLFAANVLFHVEVHWSGASDYGQRLAFAAILTLIMVVGGRIIPSFTRNWLAKQGSRALPVPFGRFDAVCIAAGVMALLCWVAAPDWLPAGLTLCFAGALHLARLSRWAGLATWRAPLLAILHIAYGFLPLGLLATGTAILRPGWLSAATGAHLLGIGAMGGMTLAVMMRASAGHTGRDLTAGPGLLSVFAALLASAGLRVWAGEAGLGSVPAMWLSASCWMLAYLGFAVLVGPWLIAPKLGAGQAVR